MGNEMGEKQQQKEEEEDGRQVATEQQHQKEASGGGDAVLGIRALDLERRDLFSTLRSELDFFFTYFVFPSFLSIHFLFYHFFQPNMSYVLRSELD